MYVYHVPLWVVKKGESWALFTFDLNRTYLEIRDEAPNEYIWRLPKDLLLFYKMVSAKLLCYTDISSVHEQTARSMPKGFPAL
jgi:hypothetical protein